MSRVISRIIRVTFAALITGSLWVMGAGCATTGSQAVKSEGEGAVVRQARPHNHTPYRYKHRGHRHARPWRKGQKPIFPCKQCDGAKKEG